MAYATIDKPSSYFNTVLYTGNGSTNAITGVGFKPDFLWLKSRTLANRHILLNLIQGTYSLSSDSTAAEVNRASDGFTSLNSDGFTLNGNGTGGDVNINSQTYVSWNWLGSNTTVSNTSGSITSTVSANTTSGFSIVSYTGTGTTSKTVGHGLGVAPAMIIIKNRSATTDWRVYHKSLGVNGTYPNFLELDLTTSSNAGDSGNFASVPTSSVFGVGNYNVVNGNGNSMIAYCFAEVKGYSKFGSYTGNGSTDGTFIYTGFKPAFFIVKTSNNTFNWVVEDNKRNTFNVVDKYLLPNTLGAEGTLTLVDFLSNGIKMRTTDNSHNGSGNTHIYMAFAENPFVSSKGLPCTAR